MILPTTLAFALRLAAQTSLPGAADRAPAEPAELWAGHLVTYGVREVPFRGKVRTRTDTYVLSRAVYDDGRIVLQEHACTVAIQKVAGVKVWMDAAALPTSTFTLHAATDGWVGTSRVRWDREDVDDDGNPGMTVHVDGICSGDLHVSNDSLTMASADVASDGRSISGRTRVNVHQRVLGAEGKCLEWMARDTTEVVHGPFAYVPVEPTATCTSLTRAGWPIDATKG